MSYCTFYNAVTFICSFPKMELLGLHMPLHMHTGQVGR